MDILDKALKEGRKALSEHESKMLLKEYGVPVTEEIEVSDEEGFMVALEKMGYPLALKACGHELSHKTEMGLVHLDIATETEAFAAWNDLLEKTGDAHSKILVQEMVKGTRELVAGLIRDPQFGPCVMFGLGGIFTEILKDVTFRIAPISRWDALEMMDEIKASRILESVRGMPPADRDMLAGILLALSTIGMEHESINEIDINPIILYQGRPVAADALVVLTDGDRAPR